MSFDFMKDFMMFEDEERFAGLCEQIEETIKDTVEWITKNNAH